MAEYIDRDAVMQAFADCVKRSNNSDFASTPTWNQAVQIVEDYPAADVVPVVHGEWEASDRHPGYATCSVCHDCYIETEWLEENKWRFCPNCGAKMGDADV